MDERIRRRQTAEITEYHVYQAIAERELDAGNREILRRIAEDEKRHYEFWAGETGERPGPDRWTVWKYAWIARILGRTSADRCAGVVNVWRNVVGRGAQASASASHSLMWRRCRSSSSSAKGMVT
ncbi:MAG: ferritin family protein [Planctomycetota bacterium]